MRSPEVKALCALLLGAAACLASAIAFPMSDRAPIGLGWAMLGLSLALAGGTWAFAPRLPRWALLVEACAITAFNSVIVTQSATTGGAVIDAFAYIWLMVPVVGFMLLVALAACIIPARRATRVNPIDVRAVVGMPR